MPVSGHKYRFYLLDFFFFCKCRLGRLSAGFAHLSAGFGDSSAGLAKKMRKTGETKKNSKCLGKGSPSCALNDTHFWSFDAPSGSAMWELSFDDAHLYSGVRTLFGLCFGVGLSAKQATKPYSDNPLNRTQNQSEPYLAVNLSSEGL